MRGTVGGAYHGGVRMTNQRGEVDVRFWLTMTVIAFLVGCGGGDGAQAPGDVAADVAGDGSGPADVLADDSGGSEDASVLDAGPDVAVPELQLWPRAALPDLDGVFVDPTIALWSTWFAHIDHTEGPAPEFRNRGAFGLGNGRVFALSGLADPMNTLHGFAGPTYDKRDGFFADIAVGLEGPDARWQDFDEEWLLQSFAAPVLAWRGTRGDLIVDIVDLVPWMTRAEAQTRPVGRAYLRQVHVRNTGSSAVAGHAVVIRGPLATAAADGISLTEAREGRRRVSYVEGAEAVADGNTLRVTLGELAPAEERTFLVVHLTLADGGDEAADRAAIAEESWDALLASSADALNAYWDRIALVTTPDALVDDLVRAQALMQKVQLSENGATEPMSNYTGTWTRDNVGPIFGLLAIGAHEEARGALDYYWRALIAAGDFQNRYDGSLDITTPAPDPPDWDSLGPFTGRTAAEGPSYVPIMYGRYVDWTGDLARPTERLGMLRRAIVGQLMNEDGLLTWSSDETFRAAMNAAFGLLLEYPHDTETWSTNSALLMTAAGTAVGRISAAIGEDAVATEAETLADRAWQAALDHLRLPDGCWAAYAFQEDGELAPGPFEDVALKELWLGVRSGDDPDAAARFGCLVDHIRYAPGVLNSPVHETYAGQSLFASASEGVYTGMLPGFTLAGYTAVGHPEAEDAFNGLREPADWSGNYGEYMIRDDNDVLQLIYNVYGTNLVDYTARFRPWEGGINLAALMGYLVGVQPDMLEGTVQLRPHLPNGWPQMSVERIRLGEAEMDVHLARTESGGHEIRMTLRGSEPLEVHLRWDHADGHTPTAWVDGQAIDGGALVRREHFGAASLELPPIQLSPGEVLVEIR